VLEAMQVQIMVAWHFWQWRLGLCGDITSFYALYMRVVVSPTSRYHERIETRKFRGIYFLCIILVN